MIHNEINKKTKDELDTAVEHWYAKVKHAIDISTPLTTSKNIQHVITSPRIKTLQWHSVLYTSPVNTEDGQ